MWKQSFGAVVVHTKVIVTLEPICFAAINALALELNAERGLVLLVVCEGARHLRTAMSRLRVGVRLHRRLLSQAGILPEPVMLLFDVVEPQQLVRESEEVFFRDSGQQTTN